MKQKIVFLVGPDRCGKTEIGKALAKRLGAMYFKASSEHNAYLQGVGRRKLSRLEGQVSPSLEGWAGVKEFNSSGALSKSELAPEALASADLFVNQLRYADPRTCDFVRQLGEQFGTSIVFDRGFPCEYAYSKVMNRQTDPAMLDYMDREWSKLGAKVVFCHRESYEGIVDDLDPKINQSMLQKLDAAYVQFFTRESTYNYSRCEYLDLKVDGEDLEAELSEIVRFLGV